MCIWIVVIGVARDHMADVTPRYTAKYAQVLTRRGDITEGGLIHLIQQFNALTSAMASSSSQPSQACIRVAHTPSPLAERVQEDMRVLYERRGVSMGGADGEDAEESMGRQTGSLEWRTQRGEMGGAAACSSSGGGKPKSMMLVPILALIA